jgi:hypothetical protein
VTRARFVVAGLVALVAVVGLTALDPAATYGSIDAGGSHRLAAIAHRPTIERHTPSSNNGGGKIVAPAGVAALVIALIALWNTMARNERQLAPVLVRSIDARAPPSVVTPPTACTTTTEDEQCSTTCNFCTGPPTVLGENHWTAAPNLACGSSRRAKQRLTTGAHWRIGCATAPTSEISQRASKASTCGLRPGRTRPPSTRTVSCGGAIGARRSHL